MNPAPRKTIGASEARKAETIRITGKSGHRVAGIEAIEQQSAGLRKTWHSVIAANGKLTDDEERDKGVRLGTSA